MKKLVSVTSRSGRQFQRYNQNGCRRVVGCIPYRDKSTTNNSASLCGTDIDSVEVLLISSQKSPRLMFPKGGWEIDESVEAAASRETFEEAGVHGIVGCELGTWNYESKSQDKCREGHMFPLLVKEELDVWPEKNIRQRVWMTVNEARKECSYSWMKEALELFVQHMNLLENKEENGTPCSLEYMRTEEQKICIGAQNGEEKVDLCVPLMV